MINGTNDTVQTNFLIWRACAWAGPIFVMAFLLFWALIGKFFPPPPAFWSGDEVAAFYLNNNLQIRTGMVGAMVFGPFYMVWSALLSRIIRFIEGHNGVLSTIEMMGGVATTMVIVLFAAVFLTASFRTETRTPQDIQMLMDLGWFIFDMTFMVTFFQMIGMGTAFLSDKRPSPLFPRWLGWFTYLSAFLFLPEIVMPFLLTGPFAWHGLINYYIALLPFFVWMMVLSFHVFFAINRIEKEVTASGLSH